MTGGLNMSESTVIQVHSSKIGTSDSNDTNDNSEEN